MRVPRLMIAHLYFFLIYHDTCTEKGKLRRRASEASKNSIHGDFSVGGVVDCVASPPSRRTRAPRDRRRRAHARARSRACCRTPRRPNRARDGWRGGERGEREREGERERFPTPHQIRDSPPHPSPVDCLLRRGEGGGGGSLLVTVVHRLDVEPRPVRKEFQRAVVPPGDVHAQVGRGFDFEV